VTDVPTLMQSLLLNASWIILNTNIPSGEAGKKHPLEVPV